MSKGQSAEKRLKNILKFFKMNESNISTIMGGVVVLVIAGLIFNYFRTTNLKTWQNLLSDNGATTTKEEGQNASLPTTYKVVKGDDLWHIAEKYYKSGYNYVDIEKENNITGAGVIYAGQELKIPNVPAKKITVAEPSVKMTASGKPATNSIEPGTEYTTVHGDTYWNIAVRAYGDGYQWPKIYQANKKIFGDPNLIHADVKIMIPALK